jgi:hypothetical protein
MHQGVAANQLTQPSAIDIRYFLQIQEDVLVAFFKRAGDHVPQQRQPVPEDNASHQLNNGDTAIHAGISAQLHISATLSYAQKQVNTDR